MSQPPSGPAPYASAPPPGGPQQPGSTATAPRQSSTRAIVGLILAILPFVITNVIGLILCLVVLLGRKNPKNGGRGIAIAGLVIAILELLAFAAIIVVAVLAVSAVPERDADGQLTETGTLTIDTLKTGDCIVKAFSASDETVLQTIDVGPCDSSHRGQVYSTFKLRGDDYPGEQRVTRRAEQECQDQIGKQLKDPEDSSQSVLYLYPREEDWAQSHQVSCIVETKSATRASAVK